MSKIKYENEQILAKNKDLCNDVKILKDDKIQ